MLYLPVVEQFFADNLLQFLPVLGGRKPFQFADQRQQLHLGKSPGADHHLHQREHLLGGQEFVHVQPVALALIGIFQLGAAHQFPVFGEESLQVIQVAGDALGRHPVFLGQFLHRYLLSPQTAEEDFQQPFLSVHFSPSVSFPYGHCIRSAGQTGVPKKIFRLKLS